MTKLQKLEKQITAREEQRRGRLKDKKDHFRRKITALEEEGKMLAEEARELRSESFQFRREVLGELNFRLPGLQQFLKEYYIASPEELEILVEKAYEQNEIALRPGPQDLVTELIRGYSLSWNRDTGEVTKLEPLTCGLDKARNNKIIMSEVVK